MNVRYYLRAYLAGIAIPTAFLLVFVAGFTLARHLWQIPGPAERIIIFPMAVLPNLWGVWNMLLARARRRRPVSSAAFGATLPLVVAPTAYLITRVIGLDLPPLMIRVFPVAFVTVVAIYNLLWKYAVPFLNGLRRGDLVRFSSMAATSGAPRPHSSITFRVAKGCGSELRLDSAGP